MWISLLLLYSLANANANEITCSTGKVRQTTNGKTYQEAVEFCTNDTKNIFLSRSCLDKKCSPYKIKRKYSYSDLFSENGKPGFKLCRNLGGEPQIIFFEVSNRFYKLDRCIFSDGFIDTGFLLQEFLN